MSEGQSRKQRGSRNFRGLRASVLVVLALCVMGIGYAVTLGPVHMAQLRAEVNDGTREISIGETIRMTPAADWVSEPLVQDLIVWPPLPPLKDWSVLVGREPGWALLSPDRALRVEVRLLEANDTRRFLGENGEGVVAEVAGESDADSAMEAARTEILASGLSVTHIDGPDGIRAVVDTGSGFLGLQAKAESGAVIEAYRPAVSQLLESVRRSASGEEVLSGTKS